MFKSLCFSFSDYTKSTGSRSSLASGNALQPRDIAAKLLEETSAFPFSKRQSSKLPGAAKAVNEGGKRNICRKWQSLFAVSCLCAAP